MKKILKIFLVVLGLIFALNALFMTFYSNFNTGILTAFILGVLLILEGIYWDRLSSKLLRVLKSLFLLGLAAIVVFVSFLFSFGKNDTISGDEDAVIVLGSGILGEQITTGLQYRLDKAIEIYNSNNDILIIVSGGQGEQETITEALAMERYLISQGVPKESIIKEELSRSTYENFQFSKKILDQRFGSDYTVCFVTNEYHIFRAGQLASFAGVTSATHAHSDTKWYAVIPSSMRECLAVIKLWLFKN